MRTDANLKAITDALTVNCGDLHAACRTAGLSPAFVHLWMRDDKVAREQIEEAQRIGWGALESAAIKRAVLGVVKGVYYQGVRVDEEVQYSDTLLVKLMEARIPQYSKKESANTVFNAPVQVNIMPRANTYEEWVKMRDAELARSSGPEALPAPDNVIENQPANAFSTLDGLI